jgi:nucleotide-binding universal stress UspA family protein
VRGSEGIPAVAPAIKRIMVPLDGSPTARQALALAAELATQAHAELTLIQAIAPTIESYPLPLGQPMTQYSVILPALRAKAAKDLDSAANELRAQGLHVETLVEDGYAAEVIVDEADKHKIDLIVMATHGYSGLRRWALGSIADKVLHAATTPLLLIRAQAN